MTPIYRLERADEFLRFNGHRELASMKARCWPVAAVGARRLNVSAPRVRTFAGKIAEAVYRPARRV
jgi:hypothetical protein